MVTPEDTWLCVHAVFPQGAGVSFPSAAPPRPVPFPERSVGGGRREREWGQSCASCSWRHHGQSPKGLCLSPLILPFPLAVGEVLVLSALEVPRLGRTLPLLPLEKHPVCGASWSVGRSMGSESSSHGLCSGPVSGWDCVLTEQPLGPTSPHRQKGGGCSGLGAEGRRSSWQVLQP